LKLPVHKPRKPFNNRVNNLSCCAFHASVKRLYDQNMTNALQTSKKQPGKLQNIRLSHFAPTLSRFGLTLFLVVAACYFDLKDNHRYMDESTISQIISYSFKVVLAARLIIFILKQFNGRPRPFAKVLAGLIGLVLLFCFAEMSIKTETGDCLYLTVTTPFFVIGSLVAFEAVCRNLQEIAKARKIKKSLIAIPRQSE